MATRRASPQTSRANGSSAQRRNSRELAAQYGKGKKFKVKCVGSQAMPEFSGNAAAVEVIRKIRAAAAKQKAHKPKATITIQLSGVTVFDEKSKSIVLSSPIQKIKYVCHDHHDVSVFAFVTQYDSSEQGAAFRLHCYQADQKQAIGFVQSMNEVFQLVHKIMRARRQQQEQAAAARREELKPDSPTSDPEETYKENSTVNLGFGIPPPPPSYKAAISKKNSDIFKIPENVSSMPAVLPPPPKPASTGSLQTVPRPQPRARQTSVPETSAVPRPQPNVNQSLPASLPRPSTNQPSAVPRTQAAQHPLTVSASSPAVVQQQAREPRILPSPPSQNNVAQQQAREPRILPSPPSQNTVAQQQAREPSPPSVVPRPSTQITVAQQQAREPSPPSVVPSQNTVAQQQARVPSPPRVLPRPSSQNSMAQQQAREPSPPGVVPRPSSQNTVAQEPSREPAGEPDTPTTVLSPPPSSTSVERPRRSRQTSPEQPQLNTTAPQATVTASSVVQPSSGNSAPAQEQTSQVPEAQVWQDWRTLEGQLSELAQEVGIDMNAPALPEGQTNFFIEDPFADDFFQTSFGDLTIDPPVTDLPLDTNNFFAAFPEDPVAASDPFTNIASTSSISSPPTADSVQSFDLFSETGSQTASVGQTPNISLPPVIEPVVPTEPGVNSFETNFPSIPAANEFQASFPATTSEPASNFEENFPSAPSSSTEPAVTSFEANFPSISSTTEPPAASFEANFPPVTTVANMVNTDSFEADFGSANFSAPNEAPSTNFEANFPTPVVSSPQTTSFETDFGSASFSTPAITQHSSIGTPPMIAAPPSKRAGGGRPRPRGRGSQSEATTLSLQPSNFISQTKTDPPQMSNTTNTTASFNTEAVTSTSVNTDASSSFVADFSNSALADSVPSFPTANDSGFSFDSTVNNESSVQLANPLYQSQTNSMQEQSTNPLAEVPAPFTVDPSWGPNNFQADVSVNQVQNFPVDPNWGVQQSLPPAQFNYQSPEHMYQQQQPGFQDSSGIYPMDSSSMGFTSPPQVSSEMFSPPGPNNGFAPNEIDMTNNPFAGDFNSPPFALHSSTPQTPGNQEQQRTVSPSRQPAPVYTGEDPFANLIPLALSPSKEPPAKEPKEPPKVIETPKTTQPNQPKRPSLNELYKQKNSFDILSSQGGLGSVKEETSEANAKHFDANTNETQWVAF